MELLLLFHVSYSIIVCANLLGLKKLAHYFVHTYVELFELILCMVSLKGSSVVLAIDYYCQTLRPLYGGILQLYTHRLILAPQCLKPILQMCWKSPCILTKLFNSVDSQTTEESVQPSGISLVCLRYC